MAAKSPANTGRRRPRELWEHRQMGWVHSCYHLNTWEKARLPEIFFSALSLESWAEVKSSYPRQVTTLDIGTSSVRPQSIAGYLGKFLSGQVNELWIIKSPPPLGQCGTLLLKALKATSQVPGLKWAWIKTSGEHQEADGGSKEGFCT